MRDREIREWLKALTKSFGEPRPFANATELEQLYQAEDYTGMFRSIQANYGLTMPTRFELGDSSDAPRTNDGRPAPGWYRGNVATSGRHRVQDATVYCGDEWISQRHPLEMAVIVISHEFAHIALDNVWHQLRDVEEVVDLTAMMFGYRKFYAIHATKATRAMVAARIYVEALLAGKSPEVNEEMYASKMGTLAPEEIRYAARLMQT